MPTRQDIEFNKYMRSQTRLFDKGLATQVAKLSLDNTRNEMARNDINSAQTHSKGGLPPIDMVR